MFTGIIEEVGRVGRLAVSASGGTLEVEAHKVIDRLAVGSSIAINGVCLTVTARTEKSFTSDLSEETVKRTSFSVLKPGRVVNLELPLTPTTPLGGHIVQGHVDGTGKFRALEPAGEGWWLRVHVPETLTRYLAEKGSVAIDGISLTVAAMAGTELAVAIIPYTFENTNLRTLEPGEPVNLECDVLAKYVEKLLEERIAARRAPAAAITLARLREEGF